MFNVQWLKGLKYLVLHNERRKVSHMNLIEASQTKHTVPDIEDWVRFRLIDFIPGHPFQSLAQEVTPKSSGI